MAQFDLTSLTHFVDKAPSEEGVLPTKTETDKILRPFDKEIPPSGRV